MSKGQDLAQLLESVHRGFAYELMALEIEVENSKDEKDPRFMSSLSHLIQLYMTGVEVLESNSDKRYRYFNNKIQALMKKKHIIEQLHMASTGRKAPKAALAEVNKEERGQRKDEHDIQVFLNAEQCDIKRIKELIQTEENKFKEFESRKKNNLKEQEDRINDRIQRRKMKSECFSPRKFDLGSNPVKKEEMDTMMEEMFPGSSGRRNMVAGQPTRKGSIGKAKVLRSLQI